MDGKYLKHLLEERGITQAALAERFNVTPVTVSRWINGSREPSDNVKMQLAQFLGVPVGALLDSPLYTLHKDGNKNAPAETKPGEGEKDKRIISMDDWITVPIVSREWTACCGAGISAADITNESEGVIKIDRKMFYRIDDRRMPFAIHCEGDCLESAGIRDGDLAVINPAEEPAQGAIALVSIAGSLSLKYFNAMPNGDVTLRSDTGRVRLSPEQMEQDEFAICGVLAAISRGRPRPLPL